MMWYLLISVFKGKRMEITLFSWMFCNFVYSEKRSNQCCKWSNKSVLSNQEWTCPACFDFLAVATCLNLVNVSLLNSAESLIISHSLHVGVEEQEDL